MTSKVKKRKTPPHQIEHKGYIYERVSKKSKQIEVDLADEVVTKIDTLIDQGKYVSRGDAVRDILRRIIESSEPIE